MKNKIKRVANMGRILQGGIFAGLLVLFLCGAAGSAQAAVNGYVVPSASYVSRGDTLTVNVYLQADSSTTHVTSMNLNLYYDPAVLEPASYTVDPTNMSTANFNVQSVNLTHDADDVYPDIVKFLAAAYGSAGLDIGTSSRYLMYTVTFTVKTTATIGSSVVELGPVGTQFVVNSGTTSVTGTGSADNFSVIYSLSSISIGSGTNYLGDLKSDVVIDAGTGADLSSVTAVSFDGGSLVTADDIKHPSTSTITADIHINAGATPATYSVWLLDSSGGAVAYGANMFTVTSPSLVLTPDSGAQGSTTSVSVVGTGTHFLSSTPTMVGSTLTFSGISVTDDTHLSCDITAGSSLGSKTVAITTVSVPGGGDETLTDSFTVTSGTSTTMPSTPEGVTATTNSSTRITVTWEASTNATSYSLAYAQATSSSWTVLSGITGLSQAVSSLIPSTAYKFKVKAANGGTGEESGWSSTVYATTSTIEAPGLTIGTVTTTTAGVNWTSVANASGYTLQWGTTTAYSTGSYSAASSESSYTIPSLTPGTLYYVRIRTDQGTKPSSAWATNSFTTDSLSTMPSTPEGVTATTNSSTRITVTWEASVNATSYTVAYKMSSASAWLTVTGVTDPQYVFLTLVPSTAYRFKVKAVNGGTGEESGWSRTVIATTSKIAAPILSIGTVGETSAGVNWTSVANASGYTLQWGTTTAYSTGSYSAASSESSYTIPSLTPGTLYYVRIRTDQGLSTPSDWATNSFTTATDSSPVIPTGLYVTTNSSTQLTLNWTTAANAATYTISYGTNTAATNLGTVSIPDTSTFKIFTGLTPSTAYYFMVKAINSAGEESDYSSIASGTTSTIEAPALSVDTVGETSAGVSWTSVTHATSYTLQWGTTTAYSTGSYTASASEISYTIPSLTAGQTYYVRICTNQSGKASSSWDTASFTTAADSSPAIPTGLYVTTDGSTQLTLNWTTAANAATYTISYGTNTAATNLGTVSIPDTSTFKIFTGLTPSTPYYFMVKAINSAGEESDYSSIASGTTSKIDAPALSVDTVSETSAGVSWTSVTHATSYTLQWGTTTSYAGGSYTAASTATSYTIPGLTAGTLYYVRICTNQSGKTSSDWDTASFTTTADDTPAVPTGLAISAITTSSMNLSWNAASNAVSYTISWGADTSMSSVVTGVTSTSHPFTGLSESTTYYFKVRSVNSAGEVSDYSSTVSGTTLTDTTTDGAETPVIDSVNPSAAAIGTIITISGHDFGDSQGASQVWFGDGITTVTVDTVQSWSDGTIMVAVPEGLESKTYALQVYRRASTLGVGALSNAVQFEVIAMSTTLKAYPNPFNPLSETLKMQVSVTDTTSVGVYIYDVTGRLVYQTTQTLTTGTTNIEWDGKIFTGQTAGDGAYLIRIVNEGNKTLISKGKIIVIKHQ